MTQETKKPTVDQAPLDPLEAPMDAVIPVVGKNRIRVTLTFDLALDDPGFPDWLHEIVPEGINGLIDAGVARPCGYLGRRYQFMKLADPKKKTKKPHKRRVSR
jgi:hypothetical protein